MSPYFNPSKKFRHSISDISWSARELSKVIGLIMSISPAIGSLTQILTRNLYFVNEKPTWDYQHKTNKAVLAELQFWQDNIKLQQLYSIRKNSNIIKVVLSDASSILMEESSSPSKVISYQEIVLQHKKKASALLSTN